jgi:hypothetical protein
MTQPLDEHHLLAGLQSQPLRHGWRRRHGHRRAHLVADLAVGFEGLLQSQQCVESVVVLALRDVGADLGSAVDQSFVLQCGQRLANGVAGHREFGRQFELTGQPVVVGTGVDLMAQHVGDLTRAISARLANRQWYCFGHAVTLSAFGCLPRPAG